MGTVGLADVAEAGRQAPILLFQLYVIKDRAFTLSLIRSRPPVSCHLPATHFTDDKIARVHKIATVRPETALQESA